MQIIKTMETDAEIRGKAYVHRSCRHEAYVGIVSATMPAFEYSTYTIASKAHFIPLFIGRYLKIRKYGMLQSISVLRNQYGPKGCNTIFS